MLNDKNIRVLERIEQLDPYSDKTTTVVTAVAICQEKMLFHRQKGQISSSKYL